MLTGFVAVTALILASAGEALACSCESSGPPCQSAFQVDAVFAGTVTGISALPDDGPPLGPGEARIPRALRVEFVDVVAFRGVQGVAVSILTSGSGPACGYTFKQGERYLGTRGVRRMGRGSSRASVPERGGWPKLPTTCGTLELLEFSAERARIFGAIKYTEIYPATRDVREHPVSSAYVQLIGPLGTRETRSDADGRYEMFSVPTGKYRIQVIPPPQFDRGTCSPRSNCAIRGCASRKISLRRRLCELHRRGRGDARGRAGASTSNRTRAGSTRGPSREASSSGANGPTPAARSRSSISRPANTSSH